MIPMVTIFYQHFLIIYTKISNHIKCCRQMSWTTFDKIGIQDIANFSERLYQLYIKLANDNRLINKYPCLTTLHIEILSKLLTFQSKFTKMRTWNLSAIDMCNMLQILNTNVVCGFFSINYTYKRVLKISSIGECNFENSPVQFDF